MSDDRKRRHCVINDRQGIRSLALDTNKGCMKIPVLRRLNWSVGSERFKESALCPILSPDPGRSPRARWNSTSLQQLADPELSLRPFQRH